LAYWKICKSAFASEAHKHQNYLTVGASVAILIDPSATTLLVPPAALISIVSTAAAAAIWPLNDRLTWEGHAEGAVWSDMTA